jgi:hypothetical protein
MNIVSIFAGRKKNLEILNKYLQKALDLNIIDEVHFWNNTRNKEDEEYLKSISNLKRSSKNLDYTITPQIIDNSFELMIKGIGAHIKINDYEIILGNRSVIRDKDKELFSLTMNNVMNTEYNTFKFVINEKINVYKNNKLIMTANAQPIIIDKIIFKTEGPGHVQYKTTEHKGFYFMDTCEKSWKNYYNHYAKGFENDIIMKCDDDIVYIDVVQLPKYIDFIKNNDYDLVFANTINNGVSAFFQQEFDLIPKQLMELEYPENGFCGSLWEDGKKAEKLHDYFIENYKKFVTHRSNKCIEINTRFSINFFGYKGKNWHKIADCYIEDEHTLTVECVNKRNFKNMLYCDFYVSHLSFAKQNETMDLNRMIDRYNMLYDIVEFNLI